MTDLPSGPDAPDFISLAQFAGVLEQAGVADPLKRIGELLSIPNTSPPAGLKLFLGAWWSEGEDGPYLHRDVARRALKQAQGSIAQGMPVAEALAAVEVEIQVQEEDSDDSRDAPLAELAEAAGDALAPEALSELARVVECSGPEIAHVQLGELWIRRLNVSGTYRSAGEKQYPWPDDAGGWGCLTVPPFEPANAVWDRFGGRREELCKAIERGRIRCMLTACRVVPKDSREARKRLDAREIGPAAAARLLEGWPGPDLMAQNFEWSGRDCELYVSAAEVLLADDGRCRWVNEAPGYVVTRSRLTDAEASHLAARKELYLDDFLKLTGITLPAGGPVWQFDGYELNCDGVRFALLGGAVPVIGADDLAELVRIERETRLAFPCAPKQMAAFFRAAEEFAAHPVFLEAVSKEPLTDIQAKRVDAICRAIAALNLDPQAVPQNKLKAIEEWCVQNEGDLKWTPGQNGTFRSAWADGRGKYFKLAEHDKYAPRRKDT